MAARPPHTEEDTPCAQAAQLLSTRCQPRGGAPPRLCQAWFNYAQSQCAGQPCEHQLCSWLGNCMAGPCATPQKPLSPHLYGSDHVCSFLATTADNKPYLAYRVASSCPLSLQGAPLFEDIPVPVGEGQLVISTLAGGQGLSGPGLG